MKKEQVKRLCILIISILVILSIEVIVHCLIEHFMILPVGISWLITLVIIVFSVLLFGLIKGLVEWIKGD